MNKKARGVVNTMGGARCPNPFDGPMLLKVWLLDYSKDSTTPKKYPEDALHIAIAAVHGIDYLLTWNFAHINNVFMKFKVQKVVENSGYECPIICTPDELIGE